MQQSRSEHVGDVKTPSAANEVGRRSREERNAENEQRGRRTERESESRNQFSEMIFFGALAHSLVERPDAELSRQLQHPAEIETKDISAHREREKKRC